MGADIGHYLGSIRPTTLQYLQSRGFTVYQVFLVFLPSSVKIYQNQGHIYDFDDIVPLHIGTTEPRTRGCSCDTTQVGTPCTGCADNMLVSIAVSCLHVSVLRNDVDDVVTFEVGGDAWEKALDDILCVRIKRRVSTHVVLVVEGTAGTQACCQSHIVLRFRGTRCCRRLRTRRCRPCLSSECDSIDGRLKDHRKRTDAM